MALSKISGINIVGIETIVPKKIEDNLKLPFLTIEERNALVKHTGIRYRKVLENKQIGIKQLYRKGIENIASKLNWDIESIDVLICVTQTSNVSIPSISCQLHGDLKITNDALCYDINSGCSGFVYGLHTISALISSLDKKNVRALLCCGDISSQLIEGTDQTTKPIFSDAASVIAIQNLEEKAAISGYFNLQTDGSGQHSIYTESDHSNSQFMKLNGIDIFNYSLKLVPNNIATLLEYANKTIDFPDLYVFHQANKLINDSIARRLKLDFSKVPSSLYDYGNTASASIPLTIGCSWNKKITNSGWILISGFGVGFSVASALIKFDPILYSTPEEVDFD
jgi:3-oxoacyl-[acyl-carrier-protein] synthase-3